GASAYVRPGERIDEAVSGFYAKVQTPVLSDIALDFGDVLTTDVYPDPLPDLFAGTQLVVVGRYRDGGAGEITLRGLVNGRSREFVYADQTLRESGGDEFIPRLWATRKIGYLLNQIRLHGEREEWVKTIVNLSVRYGIVTPYTSYLITEDDVLSSIGRDQIAANESLKLEAPAAASGGGAVDASVYQQGMESAETVENPVDEFAQTVKIVGPRTFLNVDGVWTDTQFDSDTLTTTKVQFGGDDYFALLDARPELGSAFALGARVIVIADGVAYEVVAAEAPPIEIPPSVTPEPISGVGGSTPEPNATPLPTNVPSGLLPTPVSTSGDAGGWPCAGALIPLGLVIAPLVLRRKR
ncbi:MAG TPA: hypothetical protein VI547_01090, partial [Anaerolineales bacterium]|nr:hypothetical protein [Anaerolineales bacterium]